MPQPKRRRAAPALLAAFVLFAAATARLFVFPATDQPRRADAIVMFDGGPDRRARAFELARAGYAPVLVVSIPGETMCPTAAAPSGVRLICFRPDPSTTQGESRETARLAQRYGWDEVLLVVGRQQDTRARIRLGRCFDGRILVDTVSHPLLHWPYAVVYEWGALAKALVWQRDC
jgi:hypothetical protein